MEEKKYKNGLVYALTIITTIIVYLVIHLFGEVLSNDILQEKKEYEKSISKQPVNHIISIITNKDTTPPTVELEGNKTLFEGTGSIEVCAICSDSLSGCRETKVCKKFTKSASSQTITVYDNAGNEATTEYFNVTIKDNSNKDKTPPTVKLEGDKTSFTGTGSIEVCAICRDTGSGCIKERVCKVFTKSASNQTITVYDNAGNNATTEYFNVIVKDDDNKDTTPPTVKLEGDKTSFTGTGSVEVCAICSDTESGCRETRVCKVFIESVTNQTITVYDNAGNNATTEYFNVIVKDDDSNDTTPPTVKLEGDKTSFTGTGSVEVCAICSDTGSGCRETRVCKTYTESASNQTITVYDNAGNNATTEYFTVTINEEADDIFVYLDDADKNKYINMTNQFPISDEVGKNLQGEYKVFDFKLKFKPAASGVSYVITVEKLSDSDFDEKWVKTYLDNEGVIINNCLRANGRIKTFNEYTKYRNRDNERILYEGIVSNSEALRGYKNFTYKMWVSEDLVLNNQDYLKQKFRTRINIYAVGNYS